MSDDRRSSDRPPRRQTPPRARRLRRRRLALLGAVLLLLALAVALAASLGSAHHRAGAGETIARAHDTSRSPGPRARAQAGVAPGRAQQLQVNEHILAYTSYISLGSPRKREVALTFDDGPSPYTPKILAVLRREHAVATFFEIGREVRSYPHYTAALVRAGMEVGDHTESHRALGDLPAGGQRAEIDGGAATITRAGAPPPLLMRPPYGSFDKTTLALLRARHMVMVLWSADTSDYLQPGVAKIRYVALSGARPGAIVLFHDGGGPRSQTVAALPRIISHLRARGFRLVTVSRLLRDDPPRVGQAAPVNLSGG